ncbi:hypothetical protein ACIBBB_07485 [Streptomyces sp. NPDC051217]|uniref:hypothetical protein n=1 Tax=Streptomyces sp. NPDC051217 TaxID=3365644 RepID=UPI003799F443
MKPASLTSAPIGSQGKVAVVQEGEAEGSALKSADAVVVHEEPAAIALPVFLTAAVLFAGWADLFTPGAELADPVTLSEVRGADWL